MNKKLLLISINSSILILVLLILFFGVGADYFTQKTQNEAIAQKDIISRIDSNGYALVAANLNKKQLAKLKDGVAPPEIQNELNQELKKKIKENDLQRTLLKKDVLDREKLEQFLKDKHPEIPRELPEQPKEGVISPYQLYVTPNAQSILALTSEINSAEEAYQEAVLWTWVSEELLNGVEEKWLYPEEFLSETPNYETNPVPGEIVSDCEEQANALVSLLRAIGIPAENVRVVLGMVDFDGSIGGHAWVEIYENGNWLSLEATSGPYYDEESGALIESEGMSYNYFESYQYPAVEKWYYYNDMYFYDIMAGRGNIQLDYWTKDISAFPQPRRNRR